MPTTGERQALLFLATLALIGGGARTLRTSRFAQQVGAAERLSGGPVAASLGERALASQIAAVDSARAVRAAKAQRPARSAAARRDPKSPPEPPAPVDVNRASAAELERLPRVGPALAGRIIAWREQHGPFRSLDDLRHVRGIGPATAALLAPAVTF